MAPKEPEILYVAANVVRLRERVGLTQAQLAERAQISSRALSKVEGGIVDVSLSTLCRIARALGVAPAAMLRHAKARPRRGRGRPSAK